LGDQIKEDERGVACSPHGKMRNTYKILSENLKVKDHMEDVCIDGKVILE
jgi:hypothetical protein